MDYKEILKLASANQGEVKKVTQAPALLRNLGPPKKEEKSTKGINSPGVRAFLEKINKADQTKTGQPNRTVNVAKASRDATENSNTSKQQARNRNDERSAINRPKDNKHDSKRNESSRDKNVKQSGLKRPSPSSNDHPQSKKSKLDASNKSSNGFKIPRKNSAPRPPPMRFDELLKVAEKNQKEQPSSDAVKEIMGVELGLKISEKKETEAARERPHFKSSANFKSRPSGAPTSNNTSNNKNTSSVSNNKSNQLRPPANGSNASKTNGSVAQKKNSAPSQNGAFKQPAKASIPNKNVATVNRPMNGANKPVQRSAVNQSSSMASKQQVSKVKPVLNSRPSNGNSALPKGISKDEQLMDLLSKSLKGASASVRKEVMNVIQNYKHTNQSNNKVVKEPQKRPTGTNKGGPSVAGSKPSTGAAKKPLESRALVGFDAAMSHLVPKSSTKPKGHNNYEDDDYYDDDYDDDDDSFIDDSFIDDNCNDDTKVEGLHYSEHIRQLFKYDKRKYKDDKEDTSGMESKYMDIEKEEKISSRIAKMEDLEELRKEEEEKKRKKLVKR